MDEAAKRPFSHGDAETGKTTSIGDAEKWKLELVSVDFFLITHLLFVLSLYLEADLLDHMVILHLSPLLLSANHLSPPSAHQCFVLPAHIHF